MSFKHSFKFFSITILIALALCQANPIDNGESKKVAHNNLKATHPIETTGGPAVVATHNPVTESTKRPESIHKVSTSTLHPSISVESVKSTTGTGHHAPNSGPLGTVAPTVDHVKSTKNSEALDPLHRLCDYLKPICNSTDKIVPKQLSKIQNQFKRIVQSSSGKLGFCFLEHFGFDPNLNPVSKANLLVICKSKDLGPDLKGSYKSFEVCANQNWDVAIDNELDKILAARANCTKNHNHSMKNETSIAPDLIHEDEEDEYSLISAVVNQVFEDNKGQFANSSDVEFIDVSGIATPTTSIPKLANKSTHFTSMKPQVKNMTDEARMNDPKDQSVSKKSTTHTTMKPISLINKDSTTNNKTSDAVGHHPSKEKRPLDKTKGSLAENVDPNVANITESKKVSITTNSLPGSMIIKETTTMRPTVIPTSMKLSDGASSSLNKTESSTNKTNIEATSKSKPTTVKPTTTPKPVFQTLEEVLKRQEKEKRELEDRLREERERVLKQLQKRQDEIDAQNAIKALQLQREASTNHNSDARQHQLEHERQMMIDPIGHTLKHQQYEANKQQRLMNGRK